MHYDKIIVDMKDCINSNNSFYENLDTNFEQAYSMYEKNFSHDELIELLAVGNIVQKQIAAIKFDYVSNKDDAYALLNNLTGCDGKIREAVALTINNIINSDNNARKIFADISAKHFAKATIDINANICRLIVDSAALLLNYNEFALSYTNTIVEYTKDALNELDKFIFKDKKYVINKQIFKLYWCLEALSIFYDYVDSKALDAILNKSAEQNEYTIREKVAKILINSNKFENIKTKLLNDENYYVRQILHH